MKGYLIRSMTRKKARSLASDVSLDSHDPEITEDVDHDDFMDGVFAYDDSDGDGDDLVTKSPDRHSGHQDDSELEISFADDSAGEDFCQDLLDPVKSYLREMGAVPLLSTAAETEIAIKIERGEKQIQSTLLSLPICMPCLSAIALGLRDGGLQIHTVIKNLDESDHAAIQQAKEDFLWKVGEAERHHNERSALHDDFLGLALEDEAAIKLMVRIERSSHAIAALFDDLRLQQKYIDEMSAEAKGIADQMAMAQKAIVAGTSKHAANFLKELEETSAMDRESLEQAMIAIQQGISSHERRRID